MGAKRKDLGSFAAWLHETRGSSTRTVDTYVSVIRRMLDAQRFYVTGVCDPERLTLFVEAMPARNRSLYRTAWRAFTQYASMNQIEVPNPFGDTVAPQRCEGTLPAIPDAVIAAVREFLRRKLTPAQIIMIRWHHVLPPTEVPGHVGRYHTVQVPGTTRAALIPEAVITILREWGQPDPSGQAPLLPRAPRAMDSLAEWPLMRVLAVAARSHRWDA